MAVVPDAARNRGKIAPNKMGHIGLKTRRLGEMKAWYGAVLEAETAFANDDVAFMAYDDEHHRLALVQLPDLQDAPKNATGLEHVSFGYDDMGDLLATYTRLKDQGIEPFWTINHGPSTSFYYKDPDGNRVELMIDNFRTREDLDAFFAAGNYEENFMGIIFDPAELIRRYEAGDPFEELVKRPPLPDGMSPWDMLRD